MLNIFVETVAIFFLINYFVRQGCITLITIDSRDIYNFTENYFYSSKNPVIKNYIIVFT